MNSASQMSLATGVLPSVAVVLLLLLAVPALPQPTSVSAPTNGTAAATYTEGKISVATGQGPLSYKLQTTTINGTRKHSLDVTISECSYTANGQNESYIITEQGGVERNATAEEVTELDKFFGQFRNNDFHESSFFRSFLQNFLNWFCNGSSIEQPLSFSDNSVEMSKEERNEKGILNATLNRPPCLCATGCPKK